MDAAKSYHMARVSNYLRDSLHSSKGHLLALRLSR